MTLLLSASTLAQVNGPGPSDPNLFDSVVSLPEDQSVIGGNVGGIPGQTIQLNVNSGGEVAILTSANSGSEINVFGGDVGSSFNANSGSEVNIISGTLGSFAANSGSLVSISGGTVSSFSDANFGSVVNISGGNVGSNFDANGSEVNISGGNVGAEFEVLSGSTINISGGAVGDDFYTDNSVMDISGGTFGNRFQINVGSEVDISGGVFGNTFGAFSGSDVELIGGEFRHNNFNFIGSTITLNNGDTFSGTLVDGSPFIFRNDTSDVLSDTLANATITAAPLPPADLTPTVINSPQSVGPVGLRAGQTLTIQSGGILGTDFAVVDSNLHIEGGTVGDGVEVVEGAVIITGGSVGDGFNAYWGSVVNISGGTVGDDFDAYSRFALPGAEINISGGSVGNNFDANPGSVVNISGGTVGDDFEAFSGSQVNLFGSSFLLNGEVVSGLTFGDAITLTDRSFSTTLSGVLSDGSQFSFDLNPNDFLGGDVFASDATLTLTLISNLAGDFNNDGVVDGLDFLKWQREDRTTAGLTAWETNYGIVASLTSASQVPEPNSLVAVIFTAGCLIYRLRVDY